MGVAKVPGGASTRYMGGRPFPVAVLREAKVSCDAGDIGDRGLSSLR